MMFKLISNTIFNPRKTVNSGKLMQYNFSHFKVSVVLLIILSATIRFIMFNLGYQMSNLTYAIKTFVVFLILAVIEFGIELIMIYVVLKIYKIHFIDYRKELLFIVFVEKIITLVLFNAFELLFDSRIVSSLVLVFCYAWLTYAIYILLLSNDFIKIKASKIAIICFAFNVFIIIFNTMIRLF